MSNAKLYASRGIRAGPGGVTTAGRALAAEAMLTDEEFEDIVDWAKRREVVLVSEEVLLKFNAAGVADLLGLLVPRLERADSRLQSPQSLQHSSKG